MPKARVRLKRISILIPAVGRRRSQRRDVSMPGRSQRIKVHPVIGNGSDSVRSEDSRLNYRKNTIYWGAISTTPGLYLRYSPGRKYANDLQRETGLRREFCLFPLTFSPPSRTTVSSASGLRGDLKCISQSAFP